MSGSNFLSLPGEIRNQIYSLLLIATPPLGSPRGLGQMLKLHPSILSVCRQTYSEATRILYTKNTFIAHYSLLSTLPQLRQWHTPVKAAHLAALIKRYRIYVRLDCDIHFTSEAAKQAFSGIDELTVEVSQTQFGSSNCDNLRVFETIRGVKQAKVFGSVGFEHYHRWLESVMMAPEGKDVDGFDVEIVNRKGGHDLWTVSSHTSSLSPSD